MQQLRIGIVGAGENTRLRHIPGLQKISGVKISGVVNRTAESSQRVAQEFGIPKTYDSWKQLVDDPDIDAVVIGTWPNLHCDVTCAALEAGKHVLTEARMARNVTEANKMLAASKAHPELVAQIVPSPYGLSFLGPIRQMIDDGWFGDLREMVVIGADASAWDYSAKIHWRLDAELSGLNALTLGILHETASRWVPATTRVFAQAKTFEPARPGREPGVYEPIHVPDSIQIVTELEGGARGMYHISGTILHGPGQQLHLYGSHGTVKIHFTPTERAWIGRHGDAELREYKPNADRLGRWQVEEDFVASIRDGQPVRLTDFATGLQYMKFTEAVATSAAKAEPVTLN